MKNYLMIANKIITRKFFLRDKLYSIGCLFLLLSSDNYFNNLKIDLSFALLLLILFPCIAVFVIYKYMLKQKTDNISESRKLN